MTEKEKVCAVLLDLASRVLAYELNDRITRTKFKDAAELATTAKLRDVTTPFDVDRRKVRFMVEISREVLPGTMEFEWEFG